MQKIINYLLIVIGIGVLGILVAGYVSGEGYYGKSQLFVSYSPEAVWEVLTDIEKMPLGKNDIYSIEYLGRYNNQFAWTENLKSGGYRNWRQNLRDENKKLILELTDSSYGTTGIFEFTLSQDRNNTVLEIVEDTSNKNIFIRGWDAIFGRNVETRRWQKFVRVRLFGNLLTTP